MLGGPIIKNIDDVETHEVVRIEYDDGRSASVHEKFLATRPNFVSFYNRWDPGMMSLRHGHQGDHIVYVLDGEVTVGGEVCRKGSFLFLLHGDTFGPWIAGPEGCELLGFIAGEGSAFWSDEDMDNYRKLLAERGAREGAVPRLTMAAQPWKIRRDVLPGPTYDPTEETASE